MKTSAVGPGRASRSRRGSDREAERGKLADLGPRAKDGLERGPCDAAVRVIRSRRRPRGRTEQLLDGVLGRDGVDRQAGAQLEAGDLAQAGVDLPVPVIRRRRSARAAARCGGPGCGAARRGSPGRPRTRRSASAVACTSASLARPKSAAWVAGHDPDLERRARGVRREGDARRRPPRASRSRRWLSSRTSRQNGHSPSRITNRAAPPISSATRCGTWGRSYRSRHRWSVRAPAWAPQFWTTWT